MQFLFADHVLDRDLRELRRGSDAIALEPQVFDLLVHLLGARDHVVSKDDEIEAKPDVGLVFIDPKDKAYLSLTARAEVHEDHAKAAVIWKKTDGVWWSGPDDPNVRVLRIEPRTAELWDGPASSAVAAFEFAKARLTGEEPNLGENRKVTVKM